MSAANIYVPGYDDSSTATFADGLIVAHPALHMVEVAYTWCSPSQVRELVDCVRHVRERPDTADPDEVFMVVSGFTIERSLMPGYILIDDAPLTVFQVQTLEIEALRAALHAEGCNGLESSSIV